MMKDLDWDRQKGWAWLLLLLAWFVPTVVSAQQELEITGFVDRLSPTDGEKVHLTAHEIIQAIKRQVEECYTTIKNRALHEPANPLGKYLSEQIATHEVRWKAELSEWIERRIVSLENNIAYTIAQGGLIAWETLAREFAEKAFKDKPQNFIITDTLGYVKLYFGAGSEDTNEIEKALALLEQALRLAKTKDDQEVIEEHVRMAKNALGQEA
jgi:hypothetical protein